MFCKQCGTQVPDNTQFCSRCGAPMATAAQPAGVSSSATVPPGKSKLAAGLLGILLGHFGVHNFYLGYTGKAVAQLLITLLTCGFGALISWVWGLVEGIMILTGKIDKDARGVPLKD